MRTICRWLEDAGVDAVRWDQAFELGGNTLASILEQSRSVDGAVLIATPDDLSKSRGQRLPSPRDNVLLEIGIFMSALGPRHAILIQTPDSRGHYPKLPSDLAGVTTLPLPPRSRDAARAKLTDWVSSFWGPRPSRSEPQLETRHTGRYTWDDVVRGVSHICLAIEADDFLPDAVLGLGRSGGVMAGLVAGFLGSLPVRLLDIAYDDGPRGLNVSLQRIDGQLKFPPRTSRVLIVEGATTGGLTPRRAEAALKRKFPRYDMRFAVLIQSVTSAFRADYYAFAEHGVLQPLPWHGPKSRSFLSPGDRGPATPPERGTT